MDNNNLMQTKFQVGDKVFVKTDLKVGEEYNKCIFVDKMEKLKGKITTISFTKKSLTCNEDRYYVEGINNFYFSNDMLIGLDHCKKTRVKKDLIVDKAYNGYYFNSEMAQLLGKEVTIIDEMKDFNGRTIYAIAEDANKWWWTLDMLEKIPTEQIEEHVDTCKFYGKNVKIKPLPSDVVKAVINGELVRARDMLNELIGDED